VSEQGARRSLDLDEMTAAFDHLGLSTGILRPTVAAPVDLAQLIYQAAVGPTEVSTSTVLVPRSSMPVWDVNGYYRAIGIGLPFRPTRKQMRLGYQRVGGPNNAYATYAFKRLLDPEFRRHYDAREIGEPVDDEYRWVEVRRMAAKFASAQSMITGRQVTVDDVLGEDITSRMKAQAEAERRGEEIQEKRESLDGADDEVPENVEEEFIWPYSYYLWGSRKFDDRTLSDWQEMLVQAFARQGLSLHVAVGYFDRTHAEAARVRHPKPEGGHVQILFLHECVEPTQELAESVVATYQTRHQHEPLDEPIYL
jgi:hypothetical protein